MNTIGARAAAVVAVLAGAAVSAGVAALVAGSSRRIAPFTE